MRIRPKKMKIFGCIKKSISWVVVLCFTVSSLPAYAKNTRAPEHQSPVTVPHELGIIDKTFVGTSQSPVIYIQDAHSSLEAQENIAKLIGYLIEKQGIKNV